MMHEVVYIVTPKAALPERLKGLSSDVAELLLEPFVVSVSEGDRSPWRQDDYAELVRYLFLRRLVFENGEIPELAGFVTGLRNTRNLAAWWAVRRFAIDGDAWALLGEDRTFPLSGVELPNRELVRTEVEQAWADSGSTQG